MPPPSRQVSAPPAGGAGSCIEASRLTLLSWNIFRNNRPEAIRQSLQVYLDEYAPDMLLLQESPVYDTHAFEEQELFEGYHALYAPVHEIEVGSERFDFLSTGQLILSRHPFYRTAVHELPALPRWFGEVLPAGGSVTRNVPYAQFRLCSGGTLGLYNIHLENRSLPSGRLRQVRHLLEVITQQGDDVVIVGGDFNTFLTSAFESALALFREEGFTNVFSFSRWRLLPQLDYFMIRGAATEQGVRLRGRGSDHQPILVTLHV